MAYHKFKISSIKNIKMIYLAHISLPLLSAFLFIGEWSTTHGDEASTAVLPKIILERYQNEKSNSWITITDESIPDFIIKDGDDFSVTNTESATHFLLVCHAPYPIYWNMTDVKPVHLNKIKSGFKAVFDLEGQELAKAEPKEFFSYMELFNDVSFTGSYTCRSVEDENVKKNTYVFLPGLTDKAKTLLDAGLEMEVGINGQDSVLLPCRVSKKSAEVSLARIDGNGNTTALTLKTSYDPKQGFTILKDEVSPMTGKYKCSVENEELIVSVLEEYHDDREFPIKNFIAEGAKWGRRIYGDGVECCSNSTETPSMLVMMCNNLPECDMKKRAFMNLMPKVTSKTPGLQLTSGKRNDNPCIHTTNYLFVQPFLIQCNGDGIDISGQYATEFIPPGYDAMNYVPSTSIQEISYNIGTAIRTFVYKWENGTQDGASYYYWDLSKTSLYNGDKFVIDCCGLHYHHANGRIQQIGWKNGTVTTLRTPEDLDIESSAYATDYCYKYQYDPEYEEYLITADENMSYFECIVPRWYTKKPGVTRISLDIKVPTEPVIIKDSNATVNITYSENQLGLLQLECKLSDGAPPPHMAWTKDGYELNQTDIHWSVVEDNKPDQFNIHGKNLLFMRATKEIEGKYKCNAMNERGSDQKSFIIKVTPRSYLDYWIALVVFGGFFAIIICCALRITSLEKQIASKQVEPQLAQPDA